MEATASQRPLSSDGELHPFQITVSLIPDRSTLQSVDTMSIEIVDRQQRE